MQANAPVLTTATACSSAVTGVGATEARGSQACIGNMAALVPKPMKASRNTRRSSCSRPAMASAVSTPPYWKAVLVPNVMMNTRPMKASAAPLME